MRIPALALVLAALLLVAPASLLAQEPGVLHIRATVTDADRRSVPVARHALLISDNPATAVRRRTVTSVQGTVDVRLLPGSYTIESDQPVAMHGRSYGWRETVEVASGRETTLELTADNARVPASTIVTTTPATTVEFDASSLLTRWQDSVFALWALSDFGTWSDYVAERPPVLLIRVTPRLLEGFWMRVARGAAETQGISLAPIKRLRPGFSGMRVLCGGREVAPIHPFKIERRLSDMDVIDEGLHVFDSAAIGPHCGAVTLVLSSVEEPDRTETRAVDPAVIGRIWQDFVSPSP